MAAEPNCGLEGWKFALSILGYLGAAIAFIVGFRQYLRADYWKRSEFLASEMKTYFDDPKVDATLTMIDWAFGGSNWTCPRNWTRPRTLTRGASW
jgi:hypothetical protein